MRRRLSAVVLMCFLLGASAGCRATDPPPAPAPAPAPAPSTESEPTDIDEPPSGPPTPSRRPSLPSLPNPTPTGFAEHIAVGCNGRPSADQVIVAVRRASMLPAGARPTVSTGPLCAGTWQYTVLTLPDADPLHVITSGAPESLKLETAGTHPCTPRVRAAAPAGILAVVRC